MMLKNSQDLETHLIREYGLDQVKSREYSGAYFWF